MSFRDLIIGGPRNVRKNLFRDIVIIILITICSISALALYRGLSIKDQLSLQLIQDASLLIQKRFTLFLTPFDSSLRVLAKAAESELLQFDISREENIETLFIPLLEVYDHVGRISIISDTGSFVSIVRMKVGFETISGETESDPSLLRSNIYRGAITAPEDDPVFWSESFTSAEEKSGFSASIKIRQPSSGKTAVIIFFIPAESIVNFIADIEAPEMVDIIVFNRQGLFLSNNQSDTLDNNLDDHNTNRDSHPHSQEIKDALRIWKTKEPASESVTKFTSRGMDWWAGYNSLGDSQVGAWVAVIVPESGIMKEVYLHWYNVAIPIGLILIFAIVMTFNLVRRYSFQLKDLPQQHVIESDLSDSVRRLISTGESATLEFKSTMRKNLNSGKFGKEIEIAWLKSIAAFMNSDGGILLIGVTDDGEICGISEDEFANEDKCQLHFKNLINTHIGASFARYIHLKFCNLNDKTVLFIECERVRKPVFLFIGKSEDFYVRTGPSSMKLTMSSMVTYLSER